MSNTDSVIRIAIGGKDTGETSESEARRLLAEGKLDPGALYWRPGMTDWRPIAELLVALAPEAPTAPLEGGGAGPLTDKYHQAKIATAREKLASLKKLPEALPEEIEDAEEDLQYLIEERKDRQEERAGDIQWWLDMFHKESIEEGSSDEVLPYLKIYKKPTKSQITAMNDFSERVLNTALTDQVSEFFDLYQKLFPEARKAIRPPAKASQLRTAQKQSSKNKGGCFGLVLALCAGTCALLTLVLIAK
jgi:hypothetical protein